MKRLFTAALLVGLLAFSSNSFADGPKEYMTLLYQSSSKEFYMINSKGEIESVPLTGRKLEEGLKEVMLKINALAQDGWIVEDMEAYIGSYHYYSYLLVRE